MSDLARHIRFVDEDAQPAPRAAAPVASVAPVSGAAPTVLTTLPWAWIAAWLVGWALLVALAAWWTGASASVVWVWVLVWAVPGLLVAALLTRLAVQAGEREAAALRLRRAAQSIAGLEERLRLSSRSMYSATQTLSDATQLLLEQVDTSRDDLRNQIGSAQQLALALKDQTEALVGAQGGLRKSLLQRDEAEAPSGAKGADRGADESDKPAFVQPPLGLRPATEPDRPVFESRSPDVTDEAGTNDGVPDIGEREAEPPRLDSRLEAGAVETNSGAPGVPMPLVPMLAVPSAAVEGEPPREGWQWKDMLATVDASAVRPRADMGARLAELGFSPGAIVSDGTVGDAAALWERRGRAAAVELVKVRVDGPAKALREHFEDAPEERAAAAEFVRAFEVELPESVDGRREALLSPDGRAWVLAVAALA